MKEKMKFYFLTHCTRHNNIRGLGNIVLGNMYTGKVQGKVYRFMVWNGVFYIKK